jgi:hypothetical protein
VTVERNPGPAQLFETESFAILWRTSFKGHSLDFYVYEKTGFAGLDYTQPTYGTENVLELSFVGPREEDVSPGHLVYGHLKWDGCCNVQQSDVAVMMHFCSKRGASVLGAALDAVYALGAEHLPHWSGS